MAFKIKDLMINIAPSEPGNGIENCVAGKKSDPGAALGKEGATLFCPGRRTDVVCNNRQTAAVGCTGHRTDDGDCPGHRTDGGNCPGRRTDVVVCVGGDTEIAVCVGAHTAVGCAGRWTAGPCARCTQKSPRGGLSPACDPSEMLEELNVIKAQLQAEMTAVDDEIREIEDALQPKTVAEVDELQTKLQEALDELGKIKADLAKK
jgi:hypothetical protein